MMDEVDEENKKLNRVWDEAIYNARQAFQKTFSDYDYDAAYWTIRIVSHSLDMEFKKVLETKTWDELGSYGLKADGD
jgi:hypothetical protein